MTLPVTILRRTIAVVFLTALASGAAAAPVSAAPQTAARPVPSTPVTYITPIWNGIVSGSDADVAAAVSTLRARIGEGGGVKLGFAAYVFLAMGDWHVDISSPAAVRAALGDFEQQVDAGIRHARANNIVFVITLLTAIRARTDAAQLVSYDEDRRVMQWYATNQVAPGWWTHSRYARRQYRVQQAYMKEAARILAERIAEYPETLVGIGGDGEVELASELPELADFSPFAIAEFRDWLRGEGLYATNGPFNGEAYSLADRYRGDAGPDVDSNTDGHSLNGDFGTSFESWDLRYFSWSLADGDAPDPHAIPSATYNAPAFNPLPDAGVQFFDAPRIEQRENAWWQLWNLFRQTMVWHHNKDVARWMTTTPTANGHLVPTDRWFSYQIPADYLFGSTPDNSNDRLFTSASPWWTANVAPYGGMGFTAFGVRFGTNTYLRTLPGLVDAVHTCGPGQLLAPACVNRPGGLTGVSWGLFEWNPVVPVASPAYAERLLIHRQLQPRDSRTPSPPPQPSDLAIYRDEMELLRRYRPRILAPFLWGDTDYRILNTGFETTLRQFATILRDGWAPTLHANPAALQFVLRRVDGATASQTSAQSVVVSQPTGGTVDWSASSDRPWVALDPASGHGDGTFSISLLANAVTTLPAGVYQSTVTVFAPGSVEGQRVVTVSLTVVDDSAAQPPFGSFDTPANGATNVAGSTAVTGWALDDVGVDRVEIWRDVVTGETTIPWHSPFGPGANDPREGKIFIANALFVAGSRTDVEAAFGSYPFAYRAGWGYLLLTQGLWLQGNGLFALTAFAFDREDRVSTLGTKTITVDNAHAGKPFGALDTPSYGGTVSGAFWNYGWALTPNASPACTIEHGNALVSVDSGPLETVSYGGFRTDIAASFPGFSNVNTSGGAYYLDTATLSNGTHQIGWLVTDNCGRQDGVGSRFFTVLNGGARLGAPAGDALSEPTGTGRRVEGGAPREADAGFSASGPLPISFGRAEAQIPVGANLDPVWMRTTGSDWRGVSLTSDGSHIVEVPEGARVEVQLPGVKGRFRDGYQVVNGDLRALPLGSSLDADAGVFYWQPAPGFLGGYDLVFVPAVGEGAPMRVRVVVGPSMRTMIDTPEADAVREVPFTLAGWTLDLAARDGSGVDTVHVWAYPESGGKAVFLGVATIGDARPDVAATYGAQFERAAYSLIVDQLAPGTYDVVVYPHLAATGTFEGAQTVRVHVQRPE